MPTSHFHQLNELVEIIYRLQPKSVLDVGVGFGKYGFLAREYLEIWRMNDQYDKWDFKIDGIEIYSTYITEGQKFYYNHIYEGDALKIIPSLEFKYDLIMLIDILEHFTYDEGIRFLDTAVSQGKHLLVSTPHDIGQQKCAYGNVHETHKFQWKKKHFSKFRNITFFKNYYSLIFVLGPDGKRIRKAISREHLSRKLKYHLSGLYKLYRKFTKG